MARQLLRTIALRSTAVGAALGFLGVVVVSCGSDVTCGTGTTKKGDTCVATNAPAGDGGPTGDTGTVTSTPTVGFDGVTSVSPASDSSLLVTWSPATASLTPTNQIVYNVYVATEAGGENFKAPTAVSPPGATSLIVGNLDAKATYYVVVRAVDQDQNMDTPGMPKELSAETVNDTKPPVFAGATGAAAVKGSGNSITVSWDPATDDLTAAEGMSYDVFWSDSSSKGSLPSTLGASTAPGASSAIVTHLKPLTSYSFYVKAHDAAGNSDDNMVVISGKTGADVTPPVFGGCVAVTNPGAANATLSWEPAVDDTSAPENITYNVYAVTDPVDDQTVFNLPNGSFTGVTTAVVPGLLPETTYYFVCRAEDEAMNEDTNISYRVATTLADNRPPVFKGITNTVVEATTATLTWDAATDNETDSTQIQYVVYQSTDPNPVTSGVAINPGPELGATSISIGDLTSNTTYFWAVVAQDSAGNASPPSKDVSAQTLVSFEGDVQPIFTTNCAKSGCHSSNAPMQGQDLSEGNAYTNIVSVPTRYPTQVNPNFGCQHMNRIQPGDVDKSFIVLKIEHSDQLTSANACTATQKANAPYPNLTGCCSCPDCVGGDNTWNFGLGMPKDLCITDPLCASGKPSSPGLPQSAIDTIKTWITQGALDN
jgi:hypothetical protein